MSRAGISGVVALAAVLVGILAVEYYASLPEDAALPTTTPRSPPAAAATVSTGDDPQLEARVADILARPLFSPTRRPPPGEAVVGAASVLPRLTAVLVSGRGKAVIFAGGSDGKPVTLTEGGRIGAWVVQSIGAGQVTLLGPDGPHVVRPAFAAPGATPAVTVAAQPSIESLLRQAAPNQVLPGLFAPAGSSPVPR